MLPYFRFYLRLIWVGVVEAVIFTVIYGVVWVVRYAGDVLLF
jgi:hypothetical protein